MGKVLRVQGFQGACCTPQGATTKLWEETLECNFMRTGALLIMFTPPLVPKTVPNTKWGITNICEINKCIETNMDMFNEIYKHGLIF